jgi:hypothetical protein
MSSKLKRVLLVMLLGAASGCGGSVSSDPVPECLSYEAGLQRCFRRKVEFARQPSLIPKTKAEREQIRQLCAANLERLQQNCR